MACYDRHEARYARHGCSYDRHEACYARHGFVYDRHQPYYDRLELFPQKLFQCMPHVSLEVLNTVYKLA